MPLQLPWRRSAVVKDLVTGPVQGSNPGPDVEQSMAIQGMQPQTPFSPGRPVNPYDGYSVEPRQFDFKAGTNITARPRQGRVSFNALRDLTSVYDVARMCIAHRIDSFRSFEWSVKPADGEVGDLTSAVDAGRAAVAKPDGRTPYASWISMYLEDVLRFDAGTLYRRRNRAGGVIGLEVVDGSTIAPMLDDWGRRPESPAPAFIQYANGVPWDWLTERDVVYLPYRPQPDSPYGLAPMETILLTANTDLRLAQHLLEYWAEGAIPGGTMQAPEGVSDPAQIQQWQDSWDAWIAGDQSQKVRVRWVPHGSVLNQTHPEAFDENLALWLFRKTCATYSVTPQDLGITLDTNKATGDTQMDVQERIADRPLGQHIDGIMTAYLQEDLGLPVQMETSLGAEKEDRLAEAQVWQIAINMGAAGADEFRSKVLGLPVDNERPVPRFIMTTRGGPIPLANLFEIAGPVDNETMAPQETIPLTSTPVEGAAGILPGKSMNTPGALVSTFNPDEPQFPGDESTTVPPPTTIAAPVAKSLRPVRKDDNKALVAAGLVVRAQDTGRVLMLQRGLDDTDPAAGCWEWPGGHIEGMETPWEAACREWQEETGCLIPEGTQAGSWMSGVYQGFVFDIPSEADITINRTQVINPDDPDGDCIETSAWFTPADIPGMPSLRPECRLSDFDLIGGLMPASKELTSGVTAATGIVGVNLAGRESDDFEDEDDELDDAEAVVKDLRRWRDNARNRVKAGRTPRQFTSDVIPAPVAEAVWKSLAIASTRSDVDAAFEVVAKAVKVPKAHRSADDIPGRHLHTKIAAHYAPLIAKAIRSGVGGVKAAVQTYADATPVSKAIDLPPTDAQTRAAARAALQSNVNLSPTELKSVLQDLYSDAYLAGTHVAASQTAGQVLSAFDQVASAVNWDAWKPGWAGAAQQVADGGLSDLLDGAGVTINGVLSSTVDQMGTALADSIANGDSVQTAAKGITDLLDGDTDRAEMIANTEINRAMSTASIATYQQNGITGVEWLVTEPCDICQDNEDAGVIATGDDFPSGDSEPPAHPRCMCAISPATLPDQPDDSDQQTEESE